MNRWNDYDTGQDILRRYRTFAVVGCSGTPGRASYGVSRFLLDQGYRVIPINPAEESIHGQRSYPDLGTAAKEHEIEVVDIFRRAEQASQHVNEAIAIGAKAVWMQLGVVDEEAAARAEEAGLAVVMDRCPAIDFPRTVG